MPNRIIKESIRTSRGVNALNDFQFRLWLYLITYVDDFGRGSADPELLKGIVFPRRKGVTESQIKSALAELANTGMVVLYEFDGEPFFYFPNWSDHQRIQTKHSKFPDPQESTVIHRESPLESNPIQVESNPNPNTKREVRAGAFVPPSLDEIRAYCEERNSPVDAKEFYDYFTEGNWTDAKGQKVKNWKQKLITWEKFQPNMSKPKSKVFQIPEHYENEDAKLEQMRRMAAKLGGGT